MNGMRYPVAARYVSVQELRDLGCKSTEEVECELTGEVRYPCGEYYLLDGRILYAFFKVDIIVLIAKLVRKQAVNNRVTIERMS